MAAIVCEKHRLRYDPERHPGCVLCRREAGAVPVASAAASPQPEAPAGIGSALGVAVLLWAGSGLTLYAAHRQVAGMIRGSFGVEAAAEGGLVVTEPEPVSVDPMMDRTLEEIEALADDLPSEIDREGYRDPNAEPREGEEAALLEEVEDPE